MNLLAAQEYEDQGSKHKEDINKELEDLREFWDPDTVDLMEWINKDVPKDAAFTGSMQLLAGVRLCTWRPITNHPHFEDQDLRDRTREVYMKKSKHLGIIVSNCKLENSKNKRYSLNLFSCTKYMVNFLPKKFIQH